MYAGVSLTFQYSFGGILTCFITGLNGPCYWCHPSSPPPTSQLLLGDRLPCPEQCMFDGKGLGF